MTFGSGTEVQATIERLAERLSAAMLDRIDTSRTGQERGYTASDLAEVGRSADDVKDLLTEIAEMGTA